MSETATVKRDPDAWGDSTAADMERTLREIAKLGKDLTEDDVVSAWTMRRKAERAIARIEGRA